MKKLLLVFPLLFIFHFAEAQYRFYAGVKGGPNMSFSNSTVEQWNDEQNPNFKIRHIKGLIAGYTFPGQKYSLEAGYTEQFHANVINFYGHWDYPAPPQITVNHHGTAASLVFKAVLNNPEAKIKLRTFFGGSHYAPYLFLDHDKNSWRDNRSKGFYFFPYSPDRPENFAFNPKTFNLVGNDKNIWLIQAGFEAEMEIINHFNFHLSAEFQNGLRPVSMFNFEYTYNYQLPPGQLSGEVYEPLNYGSSISKAEAINLNLGLTYSFSKRKKKTDKTDI